MSREAPKRGYNRAYYLANKEKIAEYGKKYRAANPEKIIEHRRNYYEKNKDKHGERSRAWYQANKEKVAERRRLDYEANREFKLERAKKYYNKNKSKVLERSREKIANKYGLDRVMYDALIEASGHQCNLCGTKNAGSSHGKFHVDHCHTSGKIRGVLCAGCNTAIGRLGDTYEALIKAAEYIKNPPMAEIISRIFDDGLLV